MSTPLSQFGWDERAEAALEESGHTGKPVGRVVAEHAGLFRVWVPDQVVIARPTGKRRSRSERDPSQRPVVGDWVVLGGVASSGENGLVEVLERKSFLARRDPKGDTTQPIAANVDVVFIVTAVGRDLNLRRLERYLAIVHEGRASPVVVLSKTDLSEEVDEALAQIRTVAQNVPVHAVSAQNGTGLEQLEQHLLPGKTFALIGSSGVGKTTLINRWMGSALAVNAVDDEGKGRHTTTQRQLLRMSTGALLVDTPGMRELGLFDAADGVEAAFPDIEALAPQCRFNDCSHEQEPGCAVRLAVESGNLDEARFESFRKLRAEVKGKGSGRAARHDAYTRRKK